MRQTVRRAIDNAIIFNAGAVREELKEEYPQIEFWTCTLEELPSYGSHPSTLRRGSAFFSSGCWDTRLQKVIDFSEEILKEDSPMAQMPIASLTAVLGYYDKGSSWGGRKLCEITAGTITPETYKALQAFMFDLQVNCDGNTDWLNNRESLKWQRILKAGN